MKPEKVFVTAVPRSGTKYIAKLLQRLGHPIYHENFHTGGIVSWHLPVFDITFKGPQVRLHQVRHPLRCISSVQTLFLPQSWNILNKHVQIGDGKTDMRVRCMRAWVRWNKLCERFVGEDGHRYRVEQLPDIFEQFCEWVGCEPDHSALVDVPLNTHTRKHTDYTWDDLHEADAELCEQVKSLGREYGYDV